MSAASMKISEKYSHINGLEYLLVHRPEVWHELQDLIAAVDAEKCTARVSGKKSYQEKVLYNRRDLYGQFSGLLKNQGWKESRISYWVTRNEELVRKTLALPAEEQKQEIIAAGETPIYSDCQTDFVKDRTAIEVQFGNHSLVAYDLFVKHFAFYVSDQIDVGIEILPMKSLHDRMSSGVPYFEGEFYNIIRQGRNVPAVPLVLIGMEP